MDLNHSAASGDYNSKFQHNRATYGTFNQFSRPVLGAPSKAEILRVGWIELCQIRGEHKPITGTLGMFWISDISLHFETRTTHMRLGSKIEAKFRTFWSSEKIGESDGRKVGVRFSTRAWDRTSDTVSEFVCQALVKNRSFTSAVTSPISYTTEFTDSTNRM